MPLVSCIMATKDRPYFLERAVRYYLSQNYTDTELIIVDDSVYPNNALIPDDSRILYIRLPKELTLGEKLNIGVQNSSGKLIQKLDDDDYYHPGFIRKSVATITNQSSKNVIVAMGHFLVLVLGKPDLYDPGPGWFAGGTFCFYREAWITRPFRHVPHRVDVYFLEDHPELVRIPILDPELYILIRHGRHTWNKMVPEVVVPEKRPLIGDVTEYFMQCDLYQKPIAILMRKEDAAFYEGIARQLRGE